MAKQAASVLLALFCVLAFSHLGLAQYDQEFDFFTLVLQWPFGYCSHYDCAMTPLPFNFTIHGFWPRNYVGRFLKYCYGPPVPPYTPITWQDLIDGLNRNWPSLAWGVNHNTRTWEVQWLKHGTCSLIYYYQVMYFDLAIELKESYDLLRGLENKDIVPTNLFTYSIQEIKDAVKDITTMVPDINCVFTREGNLAISEIRLCFTPGGEIMDCVPFRNAQGCTSPFAYFPETLIL